MGNRNVPIRLSEIVRQVPFLDRARFRDPVDPSRVAGNERLMLERRPETDEVKCLAEIVELDRHRFNPPRPDIGKCAARSRTVTGDHERRADLIWWDRG